MIKKKTAVDVLECTRRPADSKHGSIFVNVIDIVRPLIR